MEVKFIYRLHKLFEQWKKSDNAIDRFTIMSDIDNLIQAELVRQNNLK